MITPSSRGPIGNFLTTSKGRTVRRLGAGLEAHSTVLTLVHQRLRQPGPLLSLGATAPFTVGRSNSHSADRQLPADVATITDLAVPRTVSARNEYPAKG